MDSISTAVARILADGQRIRSRPVRPEHIRGLDDRTRGRVGGESSLLLSVVRSGSGVPRDLHGDERAPAARNRAQLEPAVRTLRKLTQAEGAFAHPSGEFAEYARPLLWESGRT